jgi:hypothetical protein
MVKQHHCQTREDVTGVLASRLAVYGITAIDSKAATMPPGSSMNADNASGLVCSRAVRA